MNEHEFVVGEFYYLINAPDTPYKFIGTHENGHGRFSDNIYEEWSHLLPYNKMKPYVSEPKFELDEEIEVSDHEDFRNSEIGYFIADVSNSKRREFQEYPIIAANKNGTPDSWVYARKVNMVTIKIIDNKNSTETYVDITRAEADKLLRDR